MFTSDNRITRVKELGAFPKMRAASAARDDDDDGGGGSSGGSACRLTSASW